MPRSIRAIDVSVPSDVRPYAWPGEHSQSNQRVARALSSSRISSRTWGV